MRKIIGIIMSIAALLACNSGEGDQSAPSYSPNPETTALGSTLNSTLQGLLNTPYSSLVSEFTPSASSTNLMNEATQDFTNMVNSTNFTTADNSAAEAAAQASALSEYNTQADQSTQKLNQSLAAENLIGSGPGYQAQSENAENVAQGAGAISSQFGQWDITNNEQQQAYEQALQSGDYATLYSLGQSNSAASLQPETDAQTALDNYLSMSNSAFSTESSTDLNQYNAALEQYQLDQQGESNLGGIGSLLGAGAGALALGPLGLVPGVGPLTGALAGGLLGGSAGSSIQL